MGKMRAKAKEGYQKSMINESWVRIPSSPPLYPVHRPPKWDENSFGEPAGRTGNAAGIGPSGPERSGANPILSATFG